MSAQNESGTSDKPLPLENPVRREILSSEARKERGYISIIAFPEGRLHVAVGDKMGGPIAAHVFTMTEARGIAAMVTEMCDLAEGKARERTYTRDEVFLIAGAGMGNGMDAVWRALEMLDRGVISPKPAPQ